MRSAGARTFATLYAVESFARATISSVIPIQAYEILRDEQGARPVYGRSQKFQADPHWRDLILFYEYFHGDSGAGLGASHQTGWTGLAATLIQLFGRADARDFIMKQQPSEAHAPASGAPADQYAHVD